MSSCKVHSKIKTHFPIKKLQVLCASSKINFKVNRARITTNLSLWIQNKIIKLPLGTNKQSFK